MAWRHADVRSSSLNCRTMVVSLCSRRQRRFEASQIVQGNGFADHDGDPLASSPLQSPGVGGQDGLSPPLRNRQQRHRGLQGDPHRARLHGHRQAIITPCDRRFGIDQDQSTGERGRDGIVIRAIAGRAIDPDVTCRPEPPTHESLSEEGVLGQEARDASLGQHHLRDQ